MKHINTTIEKQINAEALRDKAERLQQQAEELTKRVDALATSLHAHQASVTELVRELLP